MARLHLVTSQEVMLEVRQPLALGTVASQSRERSLAKVTSSADGIFRKMRRLLEGYQTALKI